MDMENIESQDKMALGYQGCLIFITGVMELLSLSIMEYTDNDGTRWVALTISKFRW